MAEIENNTLVSIIIPIYNTEKLLGRCIDSVLAQSYMNWELILVDDGSQDRSWTVCDEYMRKDSRIHAFHQKNSGVGAARNLGLDKAKGEWITFIDSDDWVSPSYLADLIDSGSLDADTLYSSGIVFHNTDGEERNFFKYYGDCISMEDLQEVKANRVFANGCPVAKLYNRDLIHRNKLRFNTKFSYNEDHLFVTEYLCIVSKVCLISANNYFYWLDDSSNSLTHKKHSSRESLIASRYMHDALSRFCQKYDCKPTEVVAPTDMQIFGAQQIVRAIKVTRTPLTKMRVMLESAALVKKESLNPNDYSGYNEKIISLLSLKNKVIMKNMLKHFIHRLRGDSKTRIVTQSVANDLEKQFRQRLAIQKMEMLSIITPTSGVTDERTNGEETIVSLSTHSKRIHQVYLAIESIMQQTMKANRIILWLDEKCFSMDSLPITLKKQIDRGLEVRFVKDIGSYTKLIYVLKEFPESNIITIDDDVIYAHDVIERLSKTHKDNPTCVCCVYGRDLKFVEGDRHLLSYNKCRTTTTLNDQKSMSIVPEGFSGVLYPPHCLNEEVFNEKVFLRIAPTCDDLWFKAMSLLNNTNVVELGRYITDHFSYNINITDCWDIGLMNKNLRGENDTQLHAVFEKYKLYDRW